MEEEIQKAPMRLVWDTCTGGGSDAKTAPWRQAGALDGCGLFAVPVASSPDGARQNGMRIPEEDFGTTNGSSEHAGGTADVLYVQFGISTSPSGLGSP